MASVKFYVAAYNFDTPDEQIFGLFRWYETEAGLHLQQWNARIKGWERHPDLIAVTGIGGINHYERISASRAEDLIREFGGTPADLKPLEPLEDEDEDE